MHSQSPEPDIQVEIRPGDLPGFAAIVSLHGEHDVASAPQVRATLRSISGNQLVDLSACSFLDSTIISTLISTSQELNREGHHLELLVPRENELVTRTLEIISMRDLLVIHEERPRPNNPRRS
jgi:anti-anti-sigma factor